MKKEATRWEATKVPGLYVRQPGGGFYARVTINGKRSWRSLKSAKITEAKKRLAELQTGHARSVTTRSNDTLYAALEKMVAFRSVRRGFDRPLRAKTAAYHKEILAIAKKLFADRPLNSFDATAILSAIQSSGYGQSRRKAVFELVKSTYKAAKENGDVDKNPLAGHVPRPVPKKDRNLPTRAELDAIIEEVPRLFPRYGHRAAFSIRFLAFSGLRVSEAHSVLWSDIRDGKIALRDGEGIKTGEREIDINPPLQALLDELAGFYGTEGRVMPAKNVRPQLAAACEAVGIEPMDHHDLRSWFITWNITSGTDVGTLAGWVGNSPKVLLERYLSVQDEQRRAAAAKLQ